VTALAMNLRRETAGCSDCLAFRLSFIDSPCRMLFEPN
jgi:hypothetical protein